MRKAFTIAAVLAAGLLAQPASADRITAGNNTSWGKAGVTLEDYWIDSAMCGHHAARMDLSDTAPAKALVVASTRLDNWTDFESVMQALVLAAPQWDRAARIMRNELEDCLSERGYVKFRLTKDQAHQLKKLKVGTLERRKYLYSLASDPAVLESQALTDS